MTFINVIIIIIIIAVILLVLLLLLLLNHIMTAYNNRNVNNYSRCFRCKELSVEKGLRRCRIARPYPLSRTWPLNWTTIVQHTQHKNGKTAPTQIIYLVVEIVWL